MSGCGWRQEFASVGDLNDTPDSAPLGPLRNGTDLKDVSQHPAQIQDGRPATLKTSNDKLNYLLLTRPVRAVTQAGPNGAGVWHGPNVKHPWPTLDTLTKEDAAASDRAALWPDFAP